MSTINAKFKSDFAKFVAKAGANADEVVKVTALNLMREVDLRSPVDEGRFRGNNNFAVKKIDSAEKPEDASGGQAIGRAAQALQSFVMGDDIYITNSLPYARVIEYGEYGVPPGSANGPNTVNGFSIKAPQGVYGVTAMSFQNYISASVRKLRK